jgi:hypothetical protein
MAPPMLDEDASLEELQQLQLQLYRLASRKFGAAAATQLVGRALAGGAAPREAAAAADPDTAARAASAVSLLRLDSAATDVTDASESDSVASG